MGMWGGCVSAVPQVCSTLVMPTRAPRGRASAAMGARVSAEARNSRPQSAFLFQQAMRATSAGSVKTTWKYSTGRRSSARAATQSRAAGPWHFGQCPPPGRFGVTPQACLRHDAKSPAGQWHLAGIVRDMAMAAAVAGRHMPAERVLATINPLDRSLHAGLRQASMADLTLSWARLTCPALARRQAGPCRRKMSASSSPGRGTRHSGAGRGSARSCRSFSWSICSQGLAVPWIIFVATWV